MNNVLLTSFLMTMGKNSSNSSTAKKYWLRLLGAGSLGEYWNMQVVEVRSQFTSSS
ncbi:MAG: hypothetical protein V7K88_18085 [Nostoc sp.]|uniref:hypothetical protein n=1 Tax=Nostoc sp. TaxID=1180 RepID=UPI002FF477A4